LPVEFEPVYERRPEELELDEPNGRVAEVVVRVTVRLLGFDFSDEVGSVEAPVKVIVKYGISSIDQAETIMIACSGVSLVPLTRLESELV
jgi:hypothetical protein